MTWPIHPGANLFPLLAPDELAQLAEDIAEHGLREPVWLWQDPDGTDYLLDGRNRVAACRIAGVEIRTQRYEGDSPTRFVVSLNIARRHLTPGQRAALAYEMLPLLEQEAENRRRQAIAAARRGETVADLPPSELKSRDLAAAPVKASGRAVGQSSASPRRLPTSPPKSSLVRCLSIALTGSFATAKPKTNASPKRRPKPPPADSS
jgi:hypothetical protein